MRKAPERNPDLKKLQVQAKQTFEADTVSLDVELITPLFGGGVMTKKVDEICWLRGSEVKASLRFWWRALYGHHYESPKDLHTAESKLFGSAKGSEGETSPVAVVVKVMKEITPMRLAFPAGDARVGTYFPGAEGMGGQEETMLGAPGAKASLMLVFRKELPIPERQEIQQALVAWLVFGGTGSRTRRGAGALAPTDPKQAMNVGYPVTAEALDAFLLQLASPKPFKGEFFCLANGAKVIRTKDGLAAQRIHEALMDHWRSFRQNRRHPDNWQGKGPWGQSLWPEGDVVRRETKMEFDNHGPHPDQKDQAPRALLGLPIVIHFKSQKKGEDFQILNEASDRYASPIWLGIARVWSGTSPQHYGLVAATPSVLKPRVLLRINQNGQSRKVPVTPAYPNPRPKREEEPTPWVVKGAADMVQRVVDAFCSPNHTSIKTPSFMPLN